MKSFLRKFQDRFTKCSHIFFKRSHWFFQVFCIRNESEKYHRYTIVDQLTKNTYVIQCAGLGAVFKTSLSGAVQNVELIQDFDSTQAFYLGFLSGFAPRDGETVTTVSQNKTPYLRLVKK